MSARIPARISSRIHARTPARVGAAIFVACMALATARPASAQPAQTSAEHAKKAQVAYDVQNWTAAIQEYQAAYQAEPKPEYLWGLAQAQRSAGDYAAAIKSYKAFKRNDAATPGQMSAADANIAKCEAELEKKQSDAAKKPPEPAATPAPTTGVAPATPAATPAPPPPEAPAGPKPFYADVLGDVLLGTGVVAAGVGAYFLFSGNADMRATPDSPTYRGYDTGVDDAAKKQTIGVIVMSGGGLLVSLAVVRYLTMSNGAKSSEPRQGLVVGPTGAGYVGRF
jgi:tetratricopeptide (TPR) repeat protein